MKRIFETATEAKTVPLVRRHPYTSGQTFLKGAVLVRNAAGTVEEGGTDPTSIIGVALERAGSGLGHEVDFDSQVSVKTGVENKVSYAVAKNQVFSGRGVNPNSSTDPVIPQVTHIGENYGIVKTGDGSWAIDFSDTTNTRVVITGILPEIDAFLFKFLDTAVAE